MTQQIRNRLRSAHNILHITQAMEIVAGVQFRKLMNRMEKFRFFSQQFNHMMERLNGSDHPLFKKRPVVGKKKIALIIVAGDKGLCGAYNENLFKEAERFLQMHQDEEIQLLLMGKKTVDRFSRKKLTIKQSVEPLARSLNSREISNWSEIYIKAFIDQEFDEMWIVYTHFINVLTRETQVEQLLPLQLKPTTQTNSDYLFEPSSEEIYQKMVPSYFVIKLQSLLLDAYASELSSRMTAMKSSAKNAEEMIEKLTLIKNKMRQLSITNEILEITAGAESLR